MDCKHDDFTEVQKGKLRCLDHWELAGGLVWCREINSFPPHRGLPLRRRLFCNSHPHVSSAWPQLILIFKCASFIFLAYVGAQPISNIVIVSGEQQRSSATHIHVSILCQSPLPSRLAHNTEQGSLCYAVGPCWLMQISLSFRYNVVNRSWDDCHWKDSCSSFPRGSRHSGLMGKWQS